MKTREQNQIEYNELRLMLTRFITNYLAGPKTCVLYHALDDFRAKENRKWCKKAKIERLVECPRPVFLSFVLCLSLFANWSISMESTAFCQSNCFIKIYK